MTIVLEARPLDGMTGCRVFSISDEIVLRVDGDRRGKVNLEVSLKISIRPKSYKNRRRTTMMYFRRQQDFFVLFLLKKYPSK